MELRALNVNNSSQVLTSDVNNYLNNTLSKQSVAILKELYQNPQMQQKTLAASIHTSATSLSNILSRLESIQPQLLVSERVGRSKYYALTDIARAYVSQSILPQTNKIHPFTPLSKEDDLISETFNILFQFQTLAGNNWDVLLDNLLIGQSDPTTESELILLFSDFIDHMKRLEVSKQSNSIYEIHAILGQGILIKRLKERIDKELKSYYALKPLFELDKHNSEKATQLIDKIFIRIAPDIFSSWHSNIDNADNLLPEADYIRVFCEINDMKNDFYNPEYQGNKQLVLQHWNAKYLFSKFLLNYIAEKCFTLYIKHRSSS